MNSIKESEEYFQQVASTWDQLQQSFFSEAVREKAFSAADLQVGKLAVDIGSGSGFITEGLLARGLRVIAVDPSAAMIEQMWRKFAGVAGIDYRLGSAESLPLEDESADYAFANMVLHHVEDPAAAITEMVRILKPGGRLVVTDLDRHSFGFLKTEHHDRWPGFKREIIRRWLMEAGLQQVSIGSVGQNCCATSSCGGDCASVGIWVAGGIKNLAR